jgi:hypothetical protein
MHNWNKLMLHNYDSCSEHDQTGRLGKGQEFFSFPLHISFGGGEH